MSETEARRMDRLKFVKLAGVGAGTAVGGSLLKAESANAASRIDVDVAVLTSDESRYAKMSQSLIDGMSLGFKRARSIGGTVDTTITKKEIVGGYSGAVPAAEKLLDDGADVVVAQVSGPVAERLAPLFEARKKSLIVANVGAHVVLPSVHSPMVLHNSLLYWQACFLAGQYAGRGVGSKGFVAASLEDAGYDTVYAFRRGFESVGGTILGHHVTHRGGADHGLPELFAAVKESGADLVFGVYSGAQATQFVRASAGTSAKVLVGGLAVEDYLLDRIGTAAVGTTSASSWTASRKTKANALFMSQFSSRFGRAADPFGALGYDTAALIVEGAQRAAKRRIGVGRLVETLGGFAFEGPRGKMTVDAASNQVNGRLAVRIVNRTARGLVNVDVGTAPAIDAFPDVLAPLANEPRSWFVNEYLCT